MCTEFHYWVTSMEQQLPVLFWFHPSTDSFICCKHGAKVGSAISSTFLACTRITSDLGPRFSTLFIKLSLSRVNIVAKSNKFSFPMILVWDRKRLTIARYSVEDQMVDESDVVLILSLGDKWLDVRESVRGQSDEAFSLPFWGGQTSVSSVRSEATKRLMEWKGTFRKSEYSRISLSELTQIQK